MLIRRLQIHIGGFAQRRMRGEDGLMADAGINPDVDRIAAMARSIGQAKFARERFIVEIEPDVGAAAVDEVRELANPIRVQNGSTLGRVESRQRHAPAALPGNHPVRP